MKARSTLFALVALLAGNAFAANPFSIYFNTENNTTSCYVDNITNINVQPDGNIVATTNGAPHMNNPGQCGVITQQTYTIGGSVSGQTGAFTLAVTAGSQTVNVTSSATSYAFPTPVATGTGYTVSVQTQPTGQICSVANATGTISANVTNANVTCGPIGTHTIGGSVTGLTATGLVMAVTAGSQTKSVASGATSYVFPTGVATGTNYTVSVQTQPAGLTCSVSNASGTIGSTNVTNANVTCLSGAVACTPGTASDASGYTAVCSGSYKLHSGGQDTLKGPNTYTFPFVFGDIWPGSRFGTSDIFTVGTKQYISIPFTPSPGHTISLNENQSYTSDAITFSVSTSPGLFNNGQANAADNATSGAQGVVCVATNNPALKLSSNGSTTAQCKLNANTVYWFNVIPAKYSSTQGQWVSGFTGANAQFGVTIYSVN